MAIKKTGGGLFDPNDRYIYFIASNMGMLKEAGTIHDYKLVAVNEVSNPEEIEFLFDQNPNLKLLLDSGVFNLAHTYSKKNNISLYEALSLNPEQMDGFDALFEKFVMLAKRFEDRLWGYIEMDQGGKQNKIKLRTRLEQMGLRPIPVYHPLTDGWDYFDYLAQNYDRICFANIAKTMHKERKQLLATMYKRHLEYPNLWVHLLGQTMSPLTNAFPPDSCDSSSWLTGIRWSDSDRAITDSKWFSPFQFDFRYDKGDNVSRKHSGRIAAHRFKGSYLNWRYKLEELEREGFIIYPRDES